MTKLKAFLSSTLAGVPAWLLLAALLPRLAVTVPVLLHPERAVSGDSAQYLELAGSLRTGGGFTSTECGPALPDTFRTPGYPAFLAALELTPWNVPAFAALLQCLFGTLTVMLAWRWLNALAPGRGAALGGLLLAADLVYVLHTPLLLTETLFMLLFVLSLGFFWPALRQGSARAAALAGLLLGAATLVRPVSVYLPVVLLPFLLGNRKAAAAFLLAALLLPGAWMARNRALTGQFTFSTIGGISLLRYPAANIEAKLNGTSWSEADRLLRARVDAANGPYTSTAQKGAAYMAAALPIIKQHPFICAAFCLRGAAYVLFGTGEEMVFYALGRDLGPILAAAPAVPLGGTIALVRAYPWAAALKLAYLLFLLFFYWSAARGLRNLWREGRRAEAGCLLAGTLYFLALSSYQGYYRFRIPMLPLLAAAAAFSPRIPLSAAGSSRSRR
ncbi:MAG: glycosyltransferase family 39 protein [Elusimicrobia bacterium]|nr:glycosyltransferase family 39 protein [Elusimicrobiota bacterium]